MKDLSQNETEWIFSGGVTTFNYGGTVTAEGGQGTPPACDAQASWRVNENIYVYGGYCGSSIGYACDLWKYNTFSGNWTLVQKGAAGCTLSSSGENQSPGNGKGVAAYWNNNFGELFLFGGAKQNFGTIYFPQPNKILYLS